MTTMRDMARPVNAADTEVSGTWCLTNALRRPFCLLWSWKRGSAARRAAAEPHRSAIAARRGELERGRRDHPDARTDPEACRGEILSGLCRAHRDHAGNGHGEIGASMVRSGVRVSTLKQAEL